ncbi:MAG: alanine--tRNA ligase [Firmicutes bacterium]|nr:alanine--tRNA ligase [Bacillota bacterium]
MKNLTAQQLRSLWLEFFSARGHTVIGSASLIPENDPTVLFTTAGMHPLVPYLLGTPHPGGKRLANVQKCVRTGDIDEVGDASHCTFFEMLGNWSLGDYFKEEMIRFSFEFLTSPAYLGIDVSRLAVSVFAGDEDAPRDEESAKIWQSCGIPKKHIFYLPKKNNWWGPAGTTGPCGPDTEMFINFGKPCKKTCSPACDCGNYLEIWNDVFMQYNKKADGTYAPLQQKNVDTGMGLERTICILQGKTSVYETDVFKPIIAAIEKASGIRYGEDEVSIRAMRIIADHIRTSVFMLGDPNGITPSNVDQGYVLRRLLRRAIRYLRQLNAQADALTKIAAAVIGVYKEAYPELTLNQEKIMQELSREEERFSKTVANGLKEFDKLCGYLQGGIVSGKAAFKLYDTYGFPLEMTVELAAERGLTVNTDDFYKHLSAHQEKSRAGAEQKFKGGLSDDSQITTRLHTATHLLHQALKTVLKDDGANQKGSNITAERLRFDFSFGRALTKEELANIEQAVNAAIAADVPVTCQEMTAQDAVQSGAIGLFSSRYGEMVKVYTIKNYSKEICGGPHAARTGELGTFKIVKEESSSAGVRRIKAVLE